ncbi:hypothetical protein PVL29_012596 [Vitis rotundifolia]|uniref:Uncharacterized protein n=1 Tax=Vitis rotundifolia TaxID=103349 RepID=A0AA38ZJ33_VITRO|nr:hypothetical protein PVL29_012596 [Vitis rotundifolia]
MWVFKRTTSYFFGFSETILKQLGFSKSSFARFEKEVMEFGAPSPMFTILATLPLLNLFTVVEGIMRVIMDMQAQVIDSLLLQILLCGVLVFMNLPVYQGLFFRKDASRMPYSVTYQSICHAPKPAPRHEGYFTLQAQKLKVETTQIFLL